MFQLAAEKEKKVEEILARYPTKRAACIPVLHLCQEQEGHVSEGVIQWVADRLQLTTAQVQGVVTFYTMYHQKPVGKNVLWVCRTLSCELRGAKELQAAAEKKLGCHAGETSKDGNFTVLKAECLAACGYAPMVQINNKFYENLTPAKLEELLDQYAQGKEPEQLETPWYQA